MRLNFFKSVFPKTLFKAAALGAIASILIGSLQPLSPALAAPFLGGNVMAQSEASEASRPILNGKATVEMVVKGKTITVEIDGTQAPVTAGNFVDLVQRGVYNGTVFHRVVTQPQPFVAQGGDPQSKDPKVPTSRLGTGGFIDPVLGTERQIPLEITIKGQKETVYGKTLARGQKPALGHKRGAIAMARSQSPNSASSQFYFALADLAFLDGNYAVFGYVTQGMDVVDGIRQGDRITSAKVSAGADNLKSGAVKLK
ncbi:MAG: peptidylprolyl isomerase [Synechococcales cyanobacterium RM1_1_8]|nr:peptidylprolyl isomerase [Synechococcales cyanobacterium RM1_1_8]